MAGNGCELQSPTAVGRRRTFASWPICRSGTGPILTGPILTGPILTGLILTGLTLTGLTLTGPLTEQACAQRPRQQLPEPEQLTLETKDRMLIRCTYYPGGFVQQPRREGEDRDTFTPKPGKEVVPIILLHGWEGRRGEFDFLASALQRRGHALLAPDLRGHGESTTRRLPNGAEQTVNREFLRAEDLYSMVLDVEACKKLLLEKNNQEELNIELLCVIGAEMGAAVALNWAQHDWSWPQLPSFKQGRDVKALVLLSPQQSFKGMTANRALTHPVVRSGLSLMIVAGQSDREGYRDAKSIYNRLERFHTIPEGRDEIIEHQDLFLIEPDTSLSGTRLIDPRARLPVFQSIDTFIDWRLARKASRFPWTERKSPLSSD